MTRAQVNFVLEDLGFHMNTVYEKMDVIQSIILDLDECVYPGAANTSIEFHTASDVNLLIIYKNGKFYAAYPFEIIEGFALISPNRRKNPYELGQVM